MKKVLIVIDSLACGGAEKSLTTLLWSLNEGKYQIDLALVRRGGELEGEVAQWVNVINVPIVGKLSPLRLLSWIYSLMWRIVRLLGIRMHLSQLHWMITKHRYKTIDKEYDAAIAYQQGFSTYYVVDKIKTKRKICWVNTDLRQAGHNPVYERQFYDKACLVVAVSPSVRDAMIEHGYADEHKLRIFYDKIDVECIRSLSNMPIDGIVRSEYMVLMVGRLSEEKNYPFALEVARELANRHFDFTLVIIGEGMERERLQENIVEMHLESHVKLMGYVANPYPYMKACDLFLHTSTYEGFGISMAEAIVLGCKIVATDLPSFRQQLEGYDQSRLSKGDKVEMADLIMELLTAKESET